MEQIKISTDHGTAVMTVLRGEVAHADRQFETQVWSEGGGGSVGPNGGYVRAPQVKSRTTEHQEVFVREAEGGEHRFQLQDAQLGVRPGSKVAVAFMAGVHAAHRVLRVRNLDTGQDVRLSNLFPWAQQHGLLPVHRVSLWRLAWWSLLMSVVLLLLVAWNDIRQQASPYRSRWIEAETRLEALDRETRKQAPWGSNQPRFTSRTSERRYLDAQHEVEDALREMKAHPFAGGPWPIPGFDTLSRMIHQVWNESVYIAVFGYLWLFLAFLSLLLIELPRYRRHRRKLALAFAEVSRQADSAFEMLVAGSTSGGFITRAGHAEMRALVKGTEQRLARQKADGASA